MPSLHARRADAYQSLVGIASASLLAIGGKQSEATLLPDAHTTPSYKLPILQKYDWPMFPALQGHGPLNATSRRRMTLISSISSLGSCPGRMI